MSKCRVYSPRFSRDEFRSVTSHYRLRGKDADINYAYVRKNACTAFKRLINEKTHPRYFLARLTGRNKNDLFHIGGNMRYFRVAVEDGQDTQSAQNLFVYRDPLDRFVSVYLNKFVHDDGARDIRKNYRKITGLEPDAASIYEFMSYARNEMRDIDCHLFPQKAHLLEVKYLAIGMMGLREGMLEIMTRSTVDRFFSSRVNSTNSEESCSKEFLGDLPAVDLKNLHSQGIKIGKSNLISSELEDFVREVYWQDYEMLGELRHKLA